MSTTQIFVKMNLELALLNIVQIIAISTFILFIIIVFIPSLIQKRKIKELFFHNNSTIKNTIVLTTFYIYLFSYLFLFNKNQSNIIIYIIGFIFAITGLIIAFVARIQLRKYWNPLTNIYNSKDIIDKGIFSITRHPIYLGRFLFFLGTMMMLNLIAIFITPFYWDYLKNRAKKEEKYLKKINPKYTKYCKKTKSLIF